MKLRAPVSIEEVNSMILHPDMPQGTMLAEADYQYDPGKSYFIAEKDGKTVGMFQVRVLTPVMVEVHMQVLREYWVTGISDEMCKEFHHNAKHYTPFLHILMYAPKECTQVMECGYRQGFKLVAVIKKGTVHLGKVTDLYIFDLAIKR